MSCLSMYLAYHKLTAVSSPGALNQWLRAQAHGYVCDGGDCNNLNLTAVEELNVKFMGEVEKPSYAQLQLDVAQGIACIAHVRNRSHFVLLTGWNSNSQQVEEFTVNDPGFPQLTYKYDEIADVLQYAAN